MTRKSDCLRISCLVDVLGLLALSLCLAAQISASNLESRDIQRPPKLKQVKHFEFTAEVLSLDLASGSELAAVAISGGAVRVWRLDTQETVWEHSMPGRLQDDELIRARFSPDGGVLAVSWFNRIRLYEVGTWKQIGSLGLKAEDVPELLELRPTEDVPKVPKLKRRPKERPRITRIPDFAFTADGKYVIASYCRNECRIALDIMLYAEATGDDPVRLWEVSTGRMVWERRYEPDRVMAHVIPSPDGKLFAAVTVQKTDYVIHMNELVTGERIFSLPNFHWGRNFEPNVVFSPDSRQFITASTDPEGYRRELFGRLATYDSKTGEKVREFGNRRGALHADISPDGRWLAAANYKTAGFQLWDVQTGRAVARERPRINWWYWWGGPPNHICFDSDGGWLVVAHGDPGFVAVYELRNQ